MSDLDRLYRLGPIQLAPSVTRWQAATLLFGAFFSIGLMTFIAVGQTYILNEHLGIPTGEQGTISGDLVFWTEIITLALFIPAGILVDRVGRRLIFAIGFLLLAVTYVLYPMAGSVDELYLYRIVYALGVVTVATALSTVMADYPAERSRGKLVATVGVLSGLGIVVINQFFGGLPSSSGWDSRRARRHITRSACRRAICSSAVLLRRAIRASCSPIWPPSSRAAISRSTPPS